MLLSKLELNGFKSFPDRINLRFDEGIMGVVGPNGCGKTNILDSIRWVLGEQRNSLLRAGKTDEVIFNGTTHLKAADMAEVSLTIKNNRGVLPLEYDEVEITRRLFRSGESEYLLNRNRCRLKDITNLFADTGMGAHAYSIFQQGMVDAVLSDKTEDRRYLFEEAAGITKYKNRKKESLKKLENTENDLIRLTDIIAEIAKNVRSLQRQAGKARRYKRIKEELQNLEVVRASARVADLQVKYSDHQQQIEDKKAQKEGLGATLDTQESSIQELKHEVDALNEKISAQAAIEADFSQQALKAENALTNVKARLDSGKKNVELWETEIQNLRQRIELLDGQKTQAENDQVETTRQIEELKESIAEIESGVLTAKSDLDNSQKSYEEARDKLHRCENELSTDNAKLEAACSAIERLNSLNRDLDQSLTKYRERKASSQENLEARKDSLNDCEDEIERADEQINANQRNHLNIDSEIEELKRQISSSQAELSGTRAKIEMLSKMVLEHEGYGSGVKKLFAWESKPEGIIDTLANLVTTDKDYYQAVESALNAYGQLVVCRTREDALAGIRYLQNESAGRVVFLVLDIAQANGGNKLSYQDENYIGTIADIVQCQDYLKPAIDSLFSVIGVFKAGTIPESFSGEAVDLEGNYYTGRGIFGGGKSSITLIGRKSELSDLQELLRDTEDRIETLSGNLDDKREELHNTAKEAERLKSEKKALLSKRESIVSEMTRLEFEFQESINRLTELEQNSSEAARQAETLQAEKAAIESRLAEKKAEHQGYADELEKLSQHHKELNENFEAKVSELNQNRLKLVELNGLLHKLEEDIRRIGEMVEESGKMIGSKEQMIAEEKDQWQNFEQEMETVKAQMSKLFEAKDQVEDEKTGLNNQRSDLMSSLNDAELKLKEVRTQINNINEDVHHLELKFAEYENSIRNIAEKIYHEYGIQITANKPEDYDEAKIEADVQKFRNVLDRIGQVNMLADEEYQTEKDRLEFLEKQHDDLQEAKKSLLEVIRKINKTAEEKFKDTFDLVRENFIGVFTSLFEGGTADIRLVNEDDLLETPIDIIARPGSKKTVSVNQLSGGERALTAISLLFSIYMVKPSPFCILDEIDAPLDDSNVTRFLKLINKFTHSTQFIVITHNKKTMEAADLLYGVTMERPGVSNIVSVKFNGNMVDNVQ